MPFPESEYNNLLLTQKEFVLAGGIFPSKERLTNRHIWNQAYEGNLELFQALFHKDPDTMAGQDKKTVLIGLIKKKKLSHIDIFFQNGWDMEQKLNAGQETALLVACQNMDSAMLDYFIEKKANVYTVNRWQENIFHLSANSINAVDILEYLYCLFPQETLQKFLLSENAAKQIPFDTHLRMFGLEGPQKAKQLEFMIQNISTLTEAQRYMSALDTVLATLSRRPFSHTEELKPCKELLSHYLSVFTEKMQLTQQLNEIKEIDKINESKKIGVYPTEKARLFKI